MTTRSAQLIAECWAAIDAADAVLRRGLSQHSQDDATGAGTDSTGHDAHHFS
jgi:hypothetical protein